MDTLLLDRSNGLASACPDGFVNAHRLLDDAETNGSDRVSRFLDRILPLRGASHADVINYLIDIPLRYAECFGVLNDGRKVSFVERRKFLGWSSHRRKRTLLFKCDELQVEIHVDPHDPRCKNSPGNVRKVELELSGAMAYENGRFSQRKFISTDGSLLQIVR